MDISIWELMNGAWGTLWVIAGFSVLCVAVTLERSIALWRFMDRARALADTVNRCLSRGAMDEGRSACERSPSPLADVYLVGYERLGRVKPDNVDAAVHRERVRVASGLRAYLWILGTIGAAAPFVGLFGTVVGIMGGFRDLEDAESSGQEVGIGVVSGSISEALIATAAGIGVAVIAVILYNYFNQRLGRINLELKMFTDEFLEELHGSTPDTHGDRPADDKGRERAGKDGADGARKAA